MFEGYLQGSIGQSNMSEPKSGRAGDCRASEAI
jgi:hypothetical protein